MKAVFFIIGVLLTLSGSVMTILEMQASELPVMDVFFTGNDYIALIAGLVLIAAGICLDLFLDPGQDCDVLPENDSQPES